MNTYRSRAGKVVDVEGISGSLDGRGGVARGGPENGGPEGAMPGDMFFSACAKESEEDE